MLKRLKLKSLLPSSALRSNSAALRLSKTPPQGGVFVSDTEPFPGWRLTPYPGYKYSQTSFRATNPNTALTRSPGKRSATGEQTVPVPQPPGHHSGQPTQTPHLPVAPLSTAPPGNKRCQCRSLPQPPGHHSGQSTPNTALTRSPGKRSATGEQTVPVPQPPGHHSGQPTPTPALTRSPGKRSATGEQTVPVPQPPGHHSGQPTQTPHLPVAPVSTAPPGNKRCQCHSLQGITPGNQPKHRPLPVAPVSAAPPGNKRCQCHRPFRRSVNKVFYVCHCPVPGEWQT